MSGPTDTYAAALARNTDLQREVLDHPERFRILTGDRPTGRLHIGHYFGTLQNRVRLQDRGVETFVLVADFQVLTDRDVTSDVDDNVINLVIDYLAIGIDPARTCVFAHSYVPYLNELLLPFLGLVSVSELERNPTVKDEIRASDRPQVSGMMLTYPVHQAADILFCKGNLVPGGKDQLPHIELARTVARRFNERFSPEQAYFPEPEVLMSDAPLLLGVDGQKMSKSRNNAIAISSTEDETAKLLKGAKTDADRTITYDPVKRPEVSNLVLLAALCLGRSPEDIAAEIGEGGGGGLKKLATEAVNEYFRPIRERRGELAADLGHVRGVLREGSEKAAEIAHQTYRDVRRLMGMDYFRD
jgi:tryptophanyl-tRNA synthetase